MSYLQGFLMQVLIYSGLWMYDEYVGFLISLTMTIIGFGIYTFAKIVEFIEPSKVPKSYYKWMLIFTAAPACVLILFSTISQGNFDWLDQ